MINQCPSYLIDFLSGVFLLFFFCLAELSKVAVLVLVSLVLVVLLLVSCNTATHSVVQSFWAGNQRVKAGVQTVIRVTLLAVSAIFS